ncbi:MAG: hypothetical protein KDK34_21500, partial [Leptospiraceae bacterium]|nr:hypothetical protein [Leptospiraceae bacterium]
GPSFVYAQVKSQKPIINHVCKNLAKTFIFARISPLKYICTQAPIATTRIHGETVCAQVVVFRSL